MTTYYIKPKKSRPDYRLVISFLWGDFQNVDTDGDAENPASHNWTELYCRNREQQQEAFSICPLREDPLILEISSQLKYLAAQVTYFLASVTESGYAEKQEGPYSNVEVLVQEFAHGFDLIAANKRVAESCWQQATSENPYPNLNQ